MLNDNMKYLIHSNNTKQPEICSFLGINRTTLYKYLSGSTPIPSDVIIKFAEFYHVTPGSLFEEKLKTTDENISIVQVLETQNKYLSVLIEQQNKQLEFFQYFFNKQSENIENDH
jgi:transcriptional regulator with XRE-family HTH domain